MRKTPVLPLSLLAALLMGGCEVHYKAHEDVRHYTERTITEYEKSYNYFNTRFRDGYTPPGPEPIRLHLSNFDTFICDGARQIIVNFDRDEMRLSTKFDGKNKYLTRRDAYMPFSDNIYDLFVMDDGTLLVQKDKGTIFQHCRPLVPDSLKGEIYGAGGTPTGGVRGGGGGVPSVPYEYTPTISPADYNRGDARFDGAMSK